MAKYRYAMNEQKDFVLSGVLDGSLITEEMVRDSRPEGQQVTNAPVLSQDFISMMSEDKNLNLLTDSEFSAIVNLR